jgi:two-component system chemotaxis response regulator CheB
MIAAQSDEVDRALWIALRTLEERAALAYKLAERGRQRSEHWVDQAFTARAKEAEQEANEIRELLRSRTHAATNLPEDAGASAGPGKPTPVAEEK